MSDSAIKVPVYGTEQKRKRREPPPKRLTRTSNAYEVMQQFIAANRPLTCAEIVKAIDSYRHTVSMALSRLRAFGWLTSEKVPGTAHNVFMYEITQEGRDAVANATSLAEVRKAKRWRSDQPADPENERLFREWRRKEEDRLVRLGCSRTYAKLWMAPWYEPIGESMDSFTTTAIVDREK